MSRPSRASRKPPKEVFLSHSTADAAALKRVAGELRRHGVKVWYSEHHIAGAHQWLDEIDRALQRYELLRIWNIDYIEK